MKNFIYIFLFLLIFTKICLAQIEDTVEVSTGWNLIGSLSSGFKSTIIRSEPPGIIISQYWGYKPGYGYQQMDTLKRGKGYWVKASQNGLIMFGSIPQVPILVSPTNGAINQSTSPILSWNASTGATSYTLQVSENISFSSFVFNQSGLLNLSQQVSGLSNSTIYYWRVSATNSFGTSSWSGVWNFTTTSGIMGIPCPGIPTITYEGKTYNTVQIGSQCWLKENLDIGTMIQGSQDQTNNSVIEKYCYDNDTANCNIYGGLYQWNEAMQYTTTAGTRGICPPDWHIPTYAELQTLSATVGGNSNALKAIGQGSGAGAGTNTSGFSALLAGYRNINGNFYYLSNYTYFWSSTEYNATDANYVRLNYDTNYFIFGSNYKDYGFSVRCLKD